MNTVLESARNEHGIHQVLWNQFRVFLKDRQIRSKMPPWRDGSNMHWNSWWGLFTYATVMTPLVFVLALDGHTGVPLFNPQPELN